MTPRAWILLSAAARADDASFFRIAGSALAALLLVLIAVPGEAGAAPLVTRFSTSRFSGEIELVDRIGGLPENADFQVVQSSDDPVSFIFSITLDPESTPVGNIVVYVGGVLQQPAVAAIGLLPGNGSPSAEPDPFADVLEYSSSRDFSFGVLGDSWDELIGGLDPGETSNRFFVAYDGSIARQLEGVTFHIWGAPLPFGSDPYPDGVLVPVPEPSTLSLVAAGGILLVGSALRRRDA